MPFPDAEHAIVPKEKVRDNLLNPNHPVGGPKAIWFASIGYTMANWQDLADDLLRLARTVDDFVAKPSPFGVKYEVSGRVGRPGHRPADVITVWIVEENSLPRLITAYPG
jgi:hypothetical protein